MASDDWELHKDTIACLYLLEKLSLKDVSARMKEEHNFDKKKHQYEYQFKKWGMKKNLRGDVWRYVSHEVRKRKRVGKRSDITLFGMQLPPDKVRKEVQRYMAIPAAKDFGTDAPSPTNPGRDIVRVVTPSPPNFQHNWPASLPWFKFLEKFRLDLIQIPDLTRVIVMAGTVSSSRTASKTTVALCAKINDLARSIPQKHGNDGQTTGASLWTAGPSAIAAESLKVILYSLANKDFHQLSDTFGFNSRDEVDKLILWLFGYILERNLDWSSHLLGTNCSTTSAILEVIYACAIRQNSLASILRLLKAGLDPNIQVEIFYKNEEFFLQRGKMRLGIIFYRLSATLNSLEIAVARSDIHLFTILLDAGANFSACKPSILERIAISLKEDIALEFAQLLMSSSVKLELLPALGIAIAKRHNHLANFLVGKLHQMAASEQLVSYCSRFRDVRPECTILLRHSKEARCDLQLQIDYTLLHLAILSENTKIVTI